MVVLPKSRNEKRMSQNLNIFDFEIDSDDMEKLRNMDENKASFGLNCESLL